MKNAMRNNAILNSYFSSFRLASFRYFVFSPGVISSFRYFTWRFSRYFVFSPGVISSFRPARTPSDGVFRLFALVFRHFAWRISLFRLFAWRYFVFPLFRLAFFSLFRLFAWRYFVFSPRQKAKRKDEKTKLRHAKRRNNAMRNNENRISCIIDNINVAVKYVDLDRTAHVGAVWATRTV